MGRTAQSSQQGAGELDLRGAVSLVPASIAAIILGHLALADIKRSGAALLPRNGRSRSGDGYVGVGLTAILRWRSFSPCATRSGAMFRKRNGRDCNDENIQ